MVAPYLWIKLWALVVSKNDKLFWTWISWHIRLILKLWQTDHWYLQATNRGHSPENGILTKPVGYSSAGSFKIPFWGSCPVLIAWKVSLIFETILLWYKCHGWQGFRNQLSIYLWKHGHLQSIVYFNLCWSDVFRLVLVSMILLHADWKWGERFYIP